MEIEQTGETQGPSPESLKIPESVVVGENIQHQEVPNKVFENNDNDIQGITQSLNQTKSNDDNKANPKSPEIEAETLDGKDVSWVDKAEDVMKRDKDDPYKEEEDAEVLQEKYMEERFGLKIDKTNK